MATKADMIAAIQAVADGSGSDTIRMALGEPGSYVKDPTGATRETGAAWAPEPKTWPVVIEGLADWFDAQGLGAIKPKLNELIGAYNQLRSDYNAGIVPTAAPEVDPLP